MEDADVIESPDLVDSPLISVRVLTYNHEKYIAQCIDSILSQNVDFDFEIVIGDDCSKDETYNICKYYQSKYPKIIKLVHNRRNLGLIENFCNINKLLRGKYIAVCAGDDYWIDNLKLNKQLAIMEKYANVSAVFTDKEVVDDQGNVLIQEKSSCSSIITEGVYSLMDLFEHPQKYSSLTMMYRKCASDNIEAMYNKVKSAFLEDYTFWVCLGTQGDFYFITDKTVAYRQNPRSITHTYDILARWEDDFKIRRNLVQVLPHEYHKYLKNNGHTYFKIAMAYRKMRKPVHFLGFMIRSFLCSPVGFVKEFK